MKIKKYKTYDKIYKMNVNFKRKRKNIKNNLVDTCPHENYLNYKQFDLHPQTTYEILLL